MLTPVGVLDLLLCAGVQGAMEGHCGGSEDDCAAGSHEWPGEAGEDGNHGGSYQQRPQPPKHHAGL